MNILAALVILALMWGAIVMLIPVLTVAAVLAVGAILIIANSDKTSGGEKFCWILAIIFLSWFAWVFYFFLAPIKPRPRYARYYYYD
jgi:hypothetical protein